MPRNFILKGAKDEYEGDWDLPLDRDPDNPDNKKGTSCMVYKIKRKRDN